MSEMSSNHSIIPTNVQMPDLCLIMCNCVSQKACWPCVSQATLWGIKLYADLELGKRFYPRRQVVDFYPDHLICGHGQYSSCEWASMERFSRSELSQMGKDPALYLRICTELCSFTVTFHRQLMNANDYAMKRYHEWTEWWRSSLLWRTLSVTHTWQVFNDYM